MYKVFFKRVLDFIGAAIALVILSPIMLVVALMIKIFDPGPVIFSQTRTGRQGNEFRFYKFRSMPVNTGDIPSGDLGKIELSWIGRFIRRTNLDELPQLLNIVRGDMSIIGPRPPIPKQTTLIELRKQNGALELRPGLTGLAQVSSYDGMPEEEKARYDGLYAANVTLWKDALIVLKTFIYVLKPPPKY